MSTPAPDHSVSPCLNVPDRGVAPGSASRLARWRMPERPAPSSGRAAPHPGPELPSTACATSEIAVPQADGAA